MIPARGPQTVFILVIVVGIIVVGIIVVGSWLWNPGCGILAVESGCGILAVESWLWNPWHLEGIWEASGGIWEASGRHLGGIREASGGIWRHLVASGGIWRHLEASWRHLEASFLFPPALVSRRSTPNLKSVLTESNRA